MIHPTAIVHPNCLIEKNVYIGAYCIIGDYAEKLDRWGEMPNRPVIIKEGTKITGHVTIDAGTDSPTVIGKDTFIMKGVHIGHDCNIGDNTIIAPHAVLGGHVTTGIHSNIAMGAIIHQRCEVSDYSMIGMGSVVTNKTDMKRAYIYVGTPAKPLKPNQKMIDKFNL
jgi:UDP-N-acetylglucosamine acyltransferase